MTSQHDTSDVSDVFVEAERGSEPKPARLPVPTDTSNSLSISSDDLVARARMLAAVALGSSWDVDDPAMPSIADSNSRILLNMLIQQIMLVAQTDATDRNEDLLGSLSLASKDLAAAIMSQLHLNPSFDEATRKKFFNAMLNSRSPSVRVLAIEELARNLDKSSLDMLKRRSTLEQSRMISALLRASLRKGSRVPEHG